MYILVQKTEYREWGMGMRKRELSVQKLWLSFATSRVDGQFIAKTVGGEDAELIRAQL